MERRGKIRSANPTIRLNSCLQKNYFRISTDNMSNAVTVKITGLRQNCQIIGAKNRHKFDVCSLVSLVVNEDYKELTLAKGVGTKLAQKIILELRDKLIKNYELIKNNG